MKIYSKIWKTKKLNEGISKVVYHVSQNAYDNLVNDELLTTLNINPAEPDGKGGRMYFLSTARSLSSAFLPNSTDSYPKLVFEIDGEELSKIKGAIGQPIEYWSPEANGQSRKSGGYFEMEDRLILDLPSISPLHKFLRRIIVPLVKIDSDKNGLRLSKYFKTIEKAIEYGKQYKISIVGVEFQGEKLHPLAKEKNIEEYIEKNRILLGEKDEDEDNDFLIKLKIKDIYSNAYPLEVVYGNAVGSSFFSEKYSIASILAFLHFLHNGWITYKQKESLMNYRELHLEWYFHPKFSRLNSFSRSERPVLINELIYQLRKKGYKKGKESDVDFFMRVFPCEDKLVKFNQPPNYEKVFQNFSPRTKELIKQAKENLLLYKEKYPELFKEVVNNENI